jgi:hypothetical protein
VPVYIPAPVGQDAGPVLTMMVDSAGGTMVSPDGTLEVTIPPGALSSPTQLGIQPITSTTPNPLGPAWRLTPEGTTFTVPAQLTFHAPVLPPDALDNLLFATQHADGVWYAQPAQSRDADAGTLTVATEHFSDWSVAASLYLYLNGANPFLHAGEMTDFQPMIMLAPSGMPVAGSQSTAVPLPQPVPLNRLANTMRTWSVGVVNNGNSSIGTITENPSTFVGTYTAPAMIPTEHFETISLRLLAPGTPLHGLVGTGDVELQGPATWSGSSHIQMTNGNTVDATFVFAESATPGQLYVQSGNVTIAVPAVNGSGCMQSISPASTTIGVNDGMMQLNASQQIAGQGTTVWLTTYTVTCPGSSSGMMSLPIEAEWWPYSITGPVWLTAVAGLYMGPVSSSDASGNLSIQSD